MIYLKNVKELINIFNIYPKYKYYFQQCFNQFVVDFVSNLDKKSIKQAFFDSKKEFEIQLNEFKTLYKIVSDEILQLPKKDIIIYEYAAGENEKIFYDEFVLSSSESVININNNINENKLETNKTNEKNQQKIKEKKSSN